VYFLLDLVDELDLGHAALHGTKIQANASKHKAMSLKLFRFQRSQQQGQGLGLGLGLGLLNRQQTPNFLASLNTSQGFYNYVL